MVDISIKRVLFLSFSFNPHPLESLGALTPLVNLFCLINFYFCWSVEVETLFFLCKKKYNFISVIIFFILREALLHACFSELQKVSNLGTFFLPPLPPPRG